MTKDDDEPIVVPPKVREALEHVIDYALDCEEQDDWEQNDCPDDHIWLSIRTVRDWLWPEEKGKGDHHSQVCEVLAREVLPINEPQPVEGK